MAIDTRYSLLSFLARKRQALSSWLEEHNIKSYQMLCEKLDKMGALPISRETYNFSKSIRDRSHRITLDDVSKKQQEPLEEKPKQKSTKKKVKKLLTNVIKTLDENLSSSK